MRLIRWTARSGMLARLRRRLGAESGFTMVIALGVMTVCSLLVAGTYAAVRGDTELTQRDLDSKRAYYAARAGVQRFFYELNQNPNLWQTCPQQTAQAAIAPGSEQKYTYKPVPANGNSACSPNPPVGGDPISTLIDTDSGTFRMQFTGYSGSPQVKRGLTVSFRKDTPLDYLWYTVYETLDPATYDVPADYMDCGWHRTPRPPDCVDIVWTSGDDLNGPAYTQDQYMMPPPRTPVFGRNQNDKIMSMAPGSNPQDICADSNCGNGVFHGEQVPNAPSISPPPDNDELLSAAQTYGTVYTGLTKIVLSAPNSITTNATITRCPTTGCLAPTTISIGRFPAKEPIIYANNGSGCSYSYSPYNITYPSSMVSGGTAPATSNCGTVYVSGTYNQSLTIAADSDVVIQGDLRKDGSTATLGLVANNFVRMMHAVTGRPTPGTHHDCGSPAATNTAGQHLIDPIIDAAILAIKHSFIVDNWDCGGFLGELTINGAIAQKYRGTVGRSPGSLNNGYLKDYNYDDRLAIAQPPYLFDIASSNWHIERETLCVPDGPAPSTSC